MVFYTGLRFLFGAPGFKQRSEVPFRSPPARRSQLVPKFWDQPFPNSLNSKTPKTSIRFFSQVQKIWDQQVEYIYSYSNAIAMR